MWFLLLISYDSWWQAYWFSANIVSGRRDFPSDAGTFIAAKQITSQVPEVVILEIIRRPVYKRLFKSNRMLRVDQKSDVNKTCQQSLFSPIYRSLHQDLMHSGCCGTTVSNVCLQAPTLSLPSPHDFFTLSPYREPAHRLKPFRTFNCFSNCYLQP